MFFVHPQINLNFNSFGKIFSGFFGDSKEKSLITKLRPRFPGKNIVFTDMGRTAFKIIIEKYNLSGSKIALPAYICDIFLPILQQYKIKPIFIVISLYIKLII